LADYVDSGAAVGGVEADRGIDVGAGDVVVGYEGGGEGEGGG